MLNVWFKKFNLGSGYSENTLVSPSFLLKLHLMFVNFFLAVIYLNILHVYNLEWSCHLLVNNKFSITKCTNFSSFSVRIYSQLWITTATNRTRSSHILLLVIKKSCFFNTIFTISTSTELAKAHLFRRFKLETTTKTICKLMPRNGRLCYKKYLLIIFVLVLLPFDKKWPWLL